MLSKTIKAILGTSLLAFALILTSCTQKELPEVITNAATDISISGATLNASISNNGGSDIQFRGLVWGTNENITLSSNLGFSDNGTGDGDYSYDITGLQPANVYYFRAYATNEIGTAYGEVLSFTTLSEPWNGVPCPDCETITDVDGNLYRTVQVGEQCWMAENLKTTKYNDNTIIQVVVDNNEWKDLAAGACCVYGNEVSYKDDYGMLYNYYAIESGKLCPEGWHVATDNEWKTLEGFADSEIEMNDAVWNSDGWRGSDAGKKLKTTDVWYSGTDEQGTDNFGFGAVPAGQRNADNGVFERINEWGLWWSAKNDNEPNVYRRHMSNHEDNIARFPSNPVSGYSVRCVKN